MEDFVTLDCLFIDGTMIEVYQHDLKTVVVDAGYGSEEKFLRLDEKEVNHLIKYAVLNQE